MTYQHAAIGLLLAGSLAVPPPVAAQAQDAAKGAALLADARKAIGGDDKLAAVKRLQLSGESKRAAGNQTVEGDTQIFIEAPDKYRVTEELSIAGGAINVTRTQVLNGAEVWDEQEGGGFPGGFRGGGGGPDGGFRGRGRFGGDVAGALGGGQGQNGQNGQAGQNGRGPIDPERLKEQQRRTRQTDLARYMLVLLLTTPDRVAWVGTAQSPDGTADVLEIKPAEGTATRLFLDSTTHLPLMITWDAPAGRGFGGFGRGRGRGGDAGGAAAPPAAPEGAAAAPAPPAPPAAGAVADDGARRGGAAGQPGTPLTFEMHLAEYKTVNGLKLPHLLTRGVNGQTQEELTIKSYKINPTFKSNTFTKSK